MLSVLVLGLYEAFLLPVRNLLKICTRETVWGEGGEVGSG